MNSRFVKTLVVILALSLALPGALAKKSKAKKTETKAEVRIDTKSVRDALEAVRDQLEALQDEVTRLEELLEGVEESAESKEKKSKVNILLAWPQGESKETKDLEVKIEEMVRDRLEDMNFTNLHKEIQELVEEALGVTGSKSFQWGSKLEQSDKAGEGVGLSFQIYWDADSGTGEIKVNGKTLEKLKP